MGGFTDGYSKSHTSALLQAIAKQLPGVPKIEHAMTRITGKLDDPVYEMLLTLGNRVYVTANCQHNLAGEGEDIKSRQAVEAGAFLGGLNAALEQEGYAISIGMDTLMKATRSTALQGRRMAQPDATIIPLKGGRS